MSTAKPRPPGHLGAAGKKFWASIVNAYELCPQDLDRLAGAAVMLDRAAAARAAIDASGVIIQDRFGIEQAHPALQIERASWNQFRLLTRELGLDVDPPGDNRPSSPPRGYR